MRIAGFFMVLDIEQDVQARRLTLIGVAGEKLLLRKFPRTLTITLFSCLRRDPEEVEDITVRYKVFAEGQAEPLFNDSLAVSPGPGLSMPGFHQFVITVTHPWRYLAVLEIDGTLLRAEWGFETVHRPDNDLSSQDQAGPRLLL